MRKCFGKNAVVLFALSWVVLLLPFVAYADGLNVTSYHEDNFPDRTKGLWSVRLRFDHQVFPSDLARSVKVTVDGRETPFEVLELHKKSKASKAARDFRIVPEKPFTGSPLVLVTVKKGLSDSSGRRLVAADHTYRFHAFTERITLNDFSTFFRSAKEKGLSLAFSSEVSTPQLSASLKITPEVKGLALSASDRGRRYRITGEFQRGVDYLLEIAETPLGGGSGSILAEEKRTFKGPGIEPAISVKTQRSVVELKSRQLFPVYLENVTKVRCELDRIPPYLVPEFADSVAKDKNSYETRLKPERISAMEALVKSGKLGGVFGGEQLRDSEVFFAPEAKDHVFGYSVPLAFRKQPEIGGVWMARFYDPEAASVRTSRLVQITDLSMSYKISMKTLLVWVTSIHSGEPVPGVEILVYTSDGDRFLVGKTDANGIVAIKDDSKFPAIGAGQESAGFSQSPLPIAKARWVVAATASDCAVEQLTRDRLKPFGIKQTKEPQARPSEVRGQIFTERGIYRPGEKVFFKFAARAYKDEKIVAPSGKQVRLEITGPRADVYYDKEMALNEFGTCHDSFETKPFFPVGTYTIKAEVDKGKSGKDTFSTTFKVQEYKRPRHLVSVSVKQDKRISTEYVSLKEEVNFLEVEAKGQYYTGGPLKHARARWKATLVPATNKVAGLDGFSFGNDDTDERFLESGESLLDKTGTLKLTIPLDSRQLTGLYGVSVSVTVLDVDGEPATDVVTFNPKPRLLVGVSRHPSKVQTEFASTLKVIVVDSQGKKVPSGEITASVMKKSYFYTQKRDSEGNINYLWESGWMTSVSSRVPISNGEAGYDIEFNDYGDRMVAFTYEDETGKYTSQTVFKVGWDEYDIWVRGEKDKAPLTANQVLPALSKKEYAIGEPVTVEFNTRRPVKKCLVTLESGDILDYRVVNVNGTKGNYQFTAGRQHRPNVYVSLIAAAGRSAFPVYQSQADSDIPTVYFGYADVKIKTDIKTISVEIAPGQSALKGKPGEKTALTFRVSDPKGKGVRAELAVCVVDEALLALTGFKTPDLSSLTDFQLPLSVFSGDLRLSLISQDLFRILGTKPLTGGDGGLGVVAASIRKDFRPVAYFNPALLTDESGNARVEFPLPDTTTTYRVYAVACDKADGFASADRKMLVVKDFFIEPSLTRFLIPGDRLTFPVVVHNETADPGQVTLAGQGSAGLKLDLLKSSTKVEPHDSTVVKSVVEVTRGMETGTVLFNGDFAGPAGKLTDAIENTIPIHSRYVPVTRVIFGSFSGRAEVPVPLPEILKTMNPDDISPADFKAYISLSTTNWNKIAPGLKYLLQYPYGCVEQTSSGIIPLAGMRGLVKQGMIPGVTIEQVDKYLQKGVARLLSMQQPEGGFSYWPGRLETSWWGTQYAVFALMTARNAGCEVPEHELNKALKYIRESLLGDPKRQELRSHPWTRLMGVFNLAMNGMLSDAEVKPFFDDYDSLDDQSKAFLLLSAKKTGALGDKEIADRLKKLNPLLDPNRRDYYNSSFRAAAVCLMAAVESRGVPEKADAWAGYLLKSLRPEGRWSSTADTGWCLLALSRYLEGKQAPQGKPFACTIRQEEGKPISADASTTSTELELDPRKLLGSGKVVFEAERKDLVNYVITVVYPDLTHDPADLSKGFTIRKKMENLNGKDEIRMGDVLKITVEIEIDKSMSGNRYGAVEYLALEDPVPAGLVPINSELATEGVLKPESKSAEQAPWVDGFYGFQPTHSEFRDDGVRVFKDRAWTGSYKYTYLARAAAEGEFWMRGSRISLMYDPDFYGKTEGVKIKILQAE